MGKLVGSTKSLWKVVKKVCTIVLLQLRSGPKQLNRPNRSEFGAQDFQFCCLGKPNSLSTCLAELNWIEINYWEFSPNLLIEQISFMPISLHLFQCPRPYPFHMSTINHPSTVFSLTISCSITVVLFPLLRFSI